MLIGPARKPDGMSKGKAGKYRSRRAQLLCDLFGQADRDGRNSRVLNRALDQSHGLIADTSGRGQDDDINPIFD